MNSVKEKCEDQNKEIYELKKEIIELRNKVRLISTTPRKEEQEGFSSTQQLKIIQLEKQIEELKLEHVINDVEQSTKDLSVVDFTNKKEAFYLECVLNLSEMLVDYENVKLDEAVFAKLDSTVVNKVQRKLLNCFIQTYGEKGDINEILSQAEKNDD